MSRLFCWCCWIDIPSVCAIVLTRAKPKTHYNALVERYDRLKAQYDEVSTAISDNEARYEQMGRFITVLKDQEGVITEFDDALWKQSSGENCSKEQGRCDGGIQRQHRNESRIRYEADMTLRIYVLSVFAMCTKCKFRDE